MDAALVDGTGDGEDGLIYGFARSISDDGQRPADQRPRIGEVALVKMHDTVRATGFDDGKAGGCTADVGDEGCAQAGF